MSASITLPPDLQAWAEAEVAAGRGKTIEDVANTAIARRWRNSIVRSMRRRRKRSEKARLVPRRCLLSWKHATRIVREG